MKNGIVLVCGFILFSGLVANSASAGPILHALYCTDVNSGPDYGFILNIKHDVVAKNTFATLSEQSIAGLRPVATYESLQVDDRRPVDGALTYKGRGFRISVPSAHPPVRPVSHMTARTEGSNSRVISADMYCTFPR